MNSLKLISLKIDGACINFKDGLNYIVGRNSSGKTTIFNSIKYAFGLNKSNLNSDIYSVELSVRINELDLHFLRDVGDPYVAVSLEEKVYQFRPNSKEFNDFLSGLFQPNYIFGRDTESIFTLLNICFLSEERSTNRREQWDAINLVCGVNVSLMSSIEKDIHALKKEIYKNKELISTVEEFSKLLTTRLNIDNLASDLNKSIELSKAEFFTSFRKKEELLIDAISKFDEMNMKSEHELRLRLAEIEKIFISLKNYSGYELGSLDEIESFVKGRNSSMSYGEEIFSKFILILAIAKLAQDSRYNFPKIIVNDSYLSRDLDAKAYRSTLEILSDVADKDKSLQYIEFTHRDDVPKEHVVLNLNIKGALNVLNN